MAFLPVSMAANQVLMAFLPVSMAANRKNYLLRKLRKMAIS